MAHAMKRYGVWYVKYKDIDGRWKRKSAGRNAKKADAVYLANKYSEQELNYHHRAPVRIIKKTVQEALEEFIKTELKNGHNGVVKVVNSVARERTVVDLFADYCKLACIEKFGTITQAHINAYFANRKTPKKTPISPRTHREELRVLRKFFRWAIKQNLCTDDPTEGMVPPKKQQKKPRFFSNEELTKIFEGAKAPYADIYRFLFLTGLRIGELANLRWDDWDEHRAALKLRVVEGDRKTRTPGNKTKREEEIPLSPDAQEVLRRRREAKESDIHIFLNDYKNPLDNDNIYRNLKRLLGDLKINNASPHTFRHTFASHLAIKGVSLYVIKELLRHKSIKETEIYAHLSGDVKRSAVNMLRIDRGGE